jgi:hypothetical protein
MEVDDEEDGLPKTTEEPDLIVKRDSEEVRGVEMPPIEPEN